MNAEFHQAVAFNNIERVLKLLNDDPSLVNDRSDLQFLALHSAVCNDSLELVELLLKSRADIHGVNDFGITALHLASSVEMIRLLIAWGAEVDAVSKDGRTPLVKQAAERESSDVIRELLQQGAAVNSANNRGMTALDIANLRQEKEKIGILIQHGGKCGTGF
jgi:ankyrin repeat protein